MWISTRNSHMGGGWQEGILDDDDEDRDPEHDCERVTRVVTRCRALSSKPPRTPEPKPEAQRHAFQLSSLLVPTSPPSPLRSPSSPH